MKKVLFLLSLLLMLTSSVKVLAQSKPKAGDTISGVVTDSVSPLMAVYITELDSADRAVAYSYTDLKGEFSFSLVNPKDRIQFSYYRKEKIVLPIDKAYFEIRMEDDKDLPPIDWEDFAPLDSRDVQDAAKAPVLIDISEYESLGLYTIDDIFNAKMGLDLPWLDDTDIIHGYVDLGLSVKWATCNVGASKPEEAGCHYAWGELEEKDNYIVENYKFYDSDDYYRITKYNSNSLDGKDGFTDDKMILDPEDDVAHVKWGGKWRMPTAEEWEELMEDCTWEWVEVNGNGGYRISGKKPGYKDCSIFLPASGSYLIMDNEFDLYGKTGDYWSSSLSTDNYYRPASGFSIDRFEYKKSVTSRHLPKSIRPVCP